MHSRASDSNILHAQKPADVLNGMLPVASSANPNWNGLVIESFAIPKLGPTERFSYSNHVVSIQRKGVVEVHETNRRKLFYPGSIAISPAEVLQKSFSFSNVRMVVAMLDRAFVRRAVGDAISGDTVDILAHVSDHDEQLDYLLRAAEIEIESGLPGGRLFLESLGTALAAHLLTHHTNKRVTLKQYGSVMPQYLLRRTIDFIQENLGKNISLDELSAGVRMSKYHFCHLFKRSTGLSPHQFVKRARIERARQLLAEHRLSLVEIANELGFSDQSPFYTNLSYGRGSNADAIRGRHVG